MRTHVLILAQDNENQKIDFEIGFLKTLSRRERFELFFRKMEESKEIMRQNGTGKISRIIKRK